MRSGVALRVRIQGSGARHLQGELLRHPVSVSIHGQPRLGAVRKKKIRLPRQKRLPRALAHAEVRRLFGCITNPIHRNRFSAPTLMLARGMSQASR